jgi:hypothetical protein
LSDLAGGRGSGRKPRANLDDRRVVDVLSALASRSTRRDAATYQRRSKGWLERARGKSTRPASPEYVNFLERIEVVEAQIELEVLTKLIADLPGNPRAEMRWLEMRYPEWYVRDRRGGP